MREKNYWRVILLLPLVLPLISLASSSIRTSITGTPGPQASFGQVFLLGSLFYGGIFYVVFITITQAILWKKPVRWDRKVSLIAPFIFLLVFIVGLQIYWIVTSSGTWTDSPRALLIYSVIVLITGYLYVGVAWAIRAIARRLGLINEGINQQSVVS